jgi:translation initiation factor IF-1
MAGGVDVKADKDRIYVVRVDGSVRMPANSGWFKLRRMAVEPGDTVVVPMDMDRQRPMALWREASSIIYQLSLGAAAIKSF